MCKKELLEKIISIVSELTEISRDEMLSRSRRSDIIEARYLVIYLLKTYGVRPYKIAKMLNLPERSVYYSIGSFFSRSDQDGSMLRKWFSDAKSELQKDCKNLETT